MRFATRIALLFAVLSFASAASAHGESLAQLMERMRAQSGPVSRAHLTSTSQLTIGDQITTTQSDAQGLRFAMYQCAQTLCAGTYFDGERVKAININGTVLPSSDLGDTMLRGERTIASHVFLDPEFEVSGGHVSDDGWTTISGVRYRTLLVADPSGVPMHVYVDPATALIRFMRDVNGDETLEYRDYRHIDGGLTLPFLVLQNGSVLERYISRGVQSDGDGTNRS